MNPKLLAFVMLLTFAALQSCAQQSIIIANKVQIKDSIKLGGKWYSKFPDTSAGGIGDTTALARKANNLSDLTDPIAARVNINLGNVDNTSDADKFSMTASLTNKTIDGTVNALINIPKSAIPLLQTALDSNLKKGDTTALMRKLNNLGDVADAAAARSNLGISVVGHSGLFSDLVNKPNTLGGYNITDGVPSSRTITINGITQDLSSSKTWTVNATNAFSSLTDVNVSSISDGQLARYNSSTGRWINFSVDSLIIALWNGYKPLGLRDTSILVPLRRFLDSMALVDNLTLQAPLYHYNNGADSGLAVQVDTPIYNAGKFLSIPISSTPPTDGQVPTFDQASSSMKFKTPTSATSGATDISVTAHPDGLDINSSTGDNGSFPLASDVNAGAQSPVEHQRLNKFTNFYNSWSPAQTAGANTLAYGSPSPDSVVIRALKALNAGGISIDTLLEHSPGPGSPV